VIRGPPVKPNIFTGPADTTGAFTIRVDNLRGKEAGVAHSYSLAAPARGYLAATPIAVSGVDNT